MAETAANADRTQGSEPPRPTRAVSLRGGGGSRWSTREDRALAAEWCLRQRSAGRRHYDIAAELGVSQSTVHDLVSQALAERKGHSVDQLRQVRTDQYEALVAVLAPRVLRHARSTLTGELLYDPETGQPVLLPDLAVIERLESLTDKLARLEGSVAPTRVTVAKSDADAAIEELAATLLQRGAGQPVPSEGA